MKSPSPPLFLLLLLFSLFIASLSQTPIPRGFRLDCGAAAPSEINGLNWLSDALFISLGTPRNLSIPGLLPTLSTLRSFPLRPQKFCYAVPVVNGARYLVRTSYFYGGLDWSQSQPPVFDQIVDGTFWTVVNTTADYSRGSASYYEAVVQGRGKFMRVCVAANSYTDFDPFISSLELIVLDGSVYNSTNFTKYVMGLIARSDFGSNGPVVRYPDDRYDRYWEPFTGSGRSTSGNQNISVSGFWNLPPAKVFGTALIAEQGSPMELQWPPVSLPNSIYYLALYFADTSLASSRAFDVFVNGYTFYDNLKVTSSGVAVFSTQWNLSAVTKITLSSESGPPPLINAGEVFGLFPISGTTVTRDVIALERMKRSIGNLPLDWNGDPCMPREYSWTGVTCSEGSQIRVVSLNLSSMGLSGSLSASIGNLTALTEISFANNNLTGRIPNLSRLKRLEKLHLQDNQLIGTLSSSLGNLTSLKELFLQNNNLTGEVPTTILQKPGLDLRLTPGNNFKLTNASLAR